MNVYGIKSLGISLTFHAAAFSLLAGVFWAGTVTFEKKEEEKDGTARWKCAGIFAEPQARVLISGVSALDLQPSPFLPPMSTDERWPESHAKLPWVENAVASGMPTSLMEMGKPRVAMRHGNLEAQGEAKTSDPIGDGGHNGAKTNSGRGAMIADATGIGQGNPKKEGRSAGGHPVPLSGNRQPVYPLDSQRRREEGVVRVSLMITTEGRVNEVVVLRSSGYALLDRAALDAIRHWRFAQTATAITAEQVITFTLR